MDHWSRATVAEGKCKSQMLRIFLWMVGRNVCRVHVRDAQSRSEHSKSTIHHIFHEVLNPLLYLYADYIRPPLDCNTPARVQKNSFIPHLYLEAVV